MAVRVAFLDRDGTINVDHGYVHRWADWQFIPGAIEAMRRLHQCGYLLAIVSNQSGIARGYYTDADVTDLHKQMTSALAAAGVPVAAIEYCPHGDDAGCACRKPAVGLARNVAALLQTDIDFGQSWTIGDKPSDIQFGKALGTHTALLHSRYWSASQLTSAPDLMAADLLAAVQSIGCAEEQRYSSRRA